MGNEPASGVRRHRTRAWLTAVLVGLTAVLVAALAVATNIATGLVPEEWAWAENAPLMWATTIALAFAVAVLGVIIHHLSTAGGESDAAGQTQSVGFASNAGTVINASGGVINVNPSSPSEPSPPAQPMQPEPRDQDDAPASTALVTRKDEQLTFPRVESAEDSFGNRFIPGNQLVNFVHTGLVLVPGDQVTIMLRAADPEGADVLLEALCSTNPNVDVNIRGGKVIWNVSAQDIGEPAHLHIYLTSMREYHRTHSGASYDDSVSFVYRVLPERPASAPAPESSERSFLDVTPEYLVGLFQDHTSVQAARLTDVYIGKWLRLTGRVGDVHSMHSSAALVVFALSPHRARVEMYFEDRKHIEEKLPVLRKGALISVVGEIERIRASCIELSKCELVDGEAQPE